MRRREFLLVIALLAIAMVSARASKPGVSEAASREKDVPASKAGTKTVPEVEAPSVEPSPLISQDKVLATAYLNTLQVLSTTNGCSLFFGGPAASVGVFNQLIRRVRKEFFSTPIGIQMSGQTTNIRNETLGREYRLFDKVSINAHGPFYRERFSRSGRLFPRTATFAANTNEVRVLMLLHELGHVMKGEDGHWLLPDDGQDDNISRSNSQKIRDVCGEQIQAIRKH